MSKDKETTVTPDPLDEPIPKDFVTLLGGLGFDDPELTLRTAAKRLRARREALRQARNGF